MEELKLKNEYFTAAELAERWSVPLSWIYANHKRIGLPKLRIGNSLRFPKIDIEAWERKNIYV